MWGHTAREWWRRHSTEFQERHIFAVIRLFVYNICSPIVAGTKMSLLLILMSIYNVCSDHLLPHSFCHFFVLRFFIYFYFGQFALLLVRNIPLPFLIVIAGELTQQLCWFLCIVGKRCCSDKNDRAWKPWETTVRSRDGCIISVFGQTYLGSWRASNLKVASPDSRSDSLQCNLCCCGQTLLAL